MEFSEVKEVNTYINLSLQIGQNPNKDNKLEYLQQLNDSPLKNYNNSERLILSQQNSSISLNNDLSRHNSNKYLKMQDLGQSSENLEDIMQEIQSVQQMNVVQEEQYQEINNNEIQLLGLNKQYQGNNNNNTQSNSNEENQIPSNIIKNNIQQQQENLDKKNKQLQQQQINQNNIIDNQEQQILSTQNTFRKRDLDLQNLKQAKSLLQLVIKKKSQVDIEKLFSTNQAVNYKKFRVHFFDKQQFLDIIVNNQSKVQDIINIALEEYQSTNEIKEKEILTYVGSAQAYELRLLDDDFTYKADYQFPAIDPSRKLLDLCLFEAVLVRNQAFKPKKKSSIDKSLPHWKKFFENQKLQENQQIILLKIELIEEQITFLIKTNKNGQVKDVMHPLRKKHSQFKFKDYIFKNKGQGEHYIVDLNFPIAQLADETLILERRQWADQPRPKQVNFVNFIKHNHFHQEEKQENDQLPSRQQLRKRHNTIHEKPDQGNFFHSIQEEPIESQTFLGPMTQVQACRYEEFELQRIISDGIKIKRTIGISDKKLHNINIEESKNILQYLWNTFQTYSVVPDVSIRDIKEIEKIQSNTLKIQVPFLDAIKSYTFECESEYQTDYIIAKIQYLRDMKKKRREDMINKSEVLQRGRYFSNNNLNNFRLSFI